MRIDKGLVYSKKCERKCCIKNFSFCFPIAMRSEIQIKDCLEKSVIVPIQVNILLTVIMPSSLDL